MALKANPRDENIYLQEAFLCSEEGMIQRDYNSSQSFYLPY